MLLRRIGAVLVAIALTAGLNVGASPAFAVAEPEPDGSTELLVPGNDPDNPAVPTPAEIAQEVAPGEQVTIGVAVQLDDGNVRIETREARGPQEAIAEIADAAAEPDVVAADVSQPVVALAGDPYRLQVTYKAGGITYLFPGQYGLSMLCTDADAVAANTNCRGEYSYQYATGAGQVIAVLDEPVQVSHPDLATNALPAISCLGDPCVAATYSTATASQHGTHVAGIAAAVTDNGIGVAGQAKGAKIQPITVLPKAASGESVAVARGIARANALNVDVINLSLAFYETDTTVEAAINAALAKNIVVVAAAGNSGVSSPVTYPAAYPGVIGVGAVNNTYAIWSGSSRGYWVDVVAPGADSILATWPQNDVCSGNIGTEAKPVLVTILTGYCYQRGTSMASPYVAGVVAQILERNPNLTAARVEALLTSNAIDLGGAGRDNTYGYGFVDTVKTLKATQPPSAPTSLSYAPGDAIVTVGFQPPADTLGLPVISYEYSMDGGPWSTAVGGRPDSPLTLDSLTSGGVPLTNGTQYSVRLRAVTANGPGTPSEALQVTPAAPLPTDFVAIDPVRVYDSRWLASPATTGLELGPLAVGTTPAGRPVSVRDGRDSLGNVTQAGVVPPGATAVAYNLTVAAQTGRGFLSVTPGDASTAPNASVINWGAPNETRANGFISGIDGSGDLRVFGGGFGTTQFIVDIVGYYRTPEPTPVVGQSVFVALDNPMRAYDSRWTGVSGVATGPMVGEATRDISVKDSRDNLTGALLAANVVPNGATGVAYNLTAAKTLGRGWLAMAPGGQTTQPAVSTINWNPGIVIANATSGKVSEDRKMRVFSASTLGGQADFVVDVVGYFIPADLLPAGTSGARFVAQPPLRAYDSRLPGAGGPLSGGVPPAPVGVPRTTAAGLDRGVPLGSSAVAYNFTSTGNAGRGFAEVVPGGGLSTGTSIINWSVPTTIANGSTVGISGLRDVTTYVGGVDASTQYIIDVAGYYTPVADN